MVAEVWVSCPAVEAPPLMVVVVAAVARVENMAAAAVAAALMAAVADARQIRQPLELEVPVVLMVAKAVAQTETQPTGPTRLI